ncbi:MAG: S-layer homology domain-containing protein [Peptostreptococcaceae bacterium]
MFNKRIKSIAVSLMLISNFVAPTFAIENLDLNNNDSEIVTSDNYITRFGFIKLINEALGFNNITQVHFDDVWDMHHDEVAKAVNAGYVSGYEDSTFRPEGFITREEISVILSNLFADKDTNFDKISQIEDFNEIGDWARSSVEMTYETGYFIGYEDNTFRPKRNLSESEAIIVVDRIIESLSTERTSILLENDKYELQKYEPKVGTYLGAYILQDELINANMNTFETMMGKKHASYFRYLGYKTGNLEVFEDWMYQVKENGSSPHVALEPNNGLEHVQRDEYLIGLAEMFAEFKDPIFLRYASEMNGDWVAWNGDTEEYIEKWKLVHDIMEEYAPNVIMVWTPFTMPEGSILEYYPGDDYVDWVGVNVYNVVYHNDNINHNAMHEDPLELLDFVYDNFSHRKPIQISEYGATHYTTTDGKYYTNFAIDKITRMYEGILNEYPRIKSIFYFNVNNLVNAPEGRRINNYALTDVPAITNTYASIVSDKTFLDSMQENNEGMLDSEIFTLRDKSIKIGEKHYANIEDVALILGGEVSNDRRIVNYDLDGRTYSFEYLKTNRKGLYIEITDLASKLDFKTEVLKDSIIIKK